MSILKFDKNFLNRVQENMSTKMTKNSFDFKNEFLLMLLGVNFL